MPTPGLDHQGGKAYGQKLKSLELSLDEINKSFLEDETYSDVEELEEKLEKCKKQFVSYDNDHTGELDMMDVKIMMEKLGQAKTHLEIKKMIAEVDKTNTGTITYSDFVMMMLGPQSSVLKIILLFEEKAKEKARPTGIAPKRDLSSLP